MMNDLEQRFRQVRQRIDDAARAQHKPAPTLLAVSKKHPSSAIRQLYQLGQRDFGESYWQEAEAKLTELADLDIIWHFIGPLQSNKTRPIAEHFAWVHSVDREKIARRLSEQRPNHLPDLNVCLQVNIDRETTKSGVLPEAVLPLAQSVAALPRLRLLDLSRNELEGYIPPALLALASLQVVDLSRNRLEGNLRDVFPGPRENQSRRGAGSTTERGHGSVEGEQGFGGAGSGPGGANGSSPAEKPPGGELVVCALASNRLSGSLPASLPPGLMMLDVADNRLTGYHPDAVLQLGQLRYLNLSRNSLEGPLPGSPHGLSRLRRLQSLDASRNRLSGGLPEDVGLLPDLQVLRLEENELSGPMPDGLARLVRLQVLAVGNNALSGALPPDLHRLQSLRVLDLANNSLSGPAPYELVGGRLLESVDLSGNALSWSP